MGLENENKTNVQISDLVRKRYLKDIMVSYLHTCISFYEYMKRVATDSKGKRLCTKVIHNLEQAIIKVNNVKHIEILDYYYSLFVAPNFQIFATAGSLLSSPKMLDYDTDSGIVEFNKIIEEQKRKAVEKANEDRANQEAIKKAKEQGKNVEFVYDKDSGKVKPLIVDEKAGA